MFNAVPAGITPYTTNFRVRHSECDAYGHVNNAQYLRYMEQTAFDASAAAGYDADDYARLGTIWLIRASRVEYLRPLFYNHRFTVQTWIAQTGRFRVRRFYHFVQQPEGWAAETVARGYSDWVYLNRETQQPKAFTPDFLAGFAPTMSSGEPSERLRERLRERLPYPPPAPPGFYTMTRTVEWRDIDTAGHVNNAVYANYVEECGFQAAANAGWTPQRALDANIAIVARDLWIEYVGQARWGDNLRLTTFLSDARRISSYRHVRIERDEANGGGGELIARARTLFVFAHPQTGRVVRVPDEFIHDFRPQIAEG